MFQKLLCITFVAVMALLLFSGCQKNEIPVDTDSAVTDGGSAEPDDGSGLSAESFGGMFSILGRLADGYSFPYNELDGNGTKSELDSAIFKRNMVIQNKYDFQLVSLYLPWDQMFRAVQTDSMAGASHEYDMILAPTIVSSQIAANGLLVNLSELPYFDLQKPYYSQTLLEDTSIGNIHYYAHGHFSLGTYNAVGGLYFNKDLHRNYEGLADPYDLVKNGTWTWEEMFAMCSEATEIDETGEANMGQYQYGLAVGIYAWQPFFYSTGATLIQKNENDMPLLNVSDSSVVIEEVNRVMNDFKTTFFTSSTNVTSKYNSMQIFSEGRSLFMIDPIYCIPEYFLDSNVNYGILPMPKYRADQTKYYSQTHAYHSTCLSVPKINDDLRKAGKLFEELAYQSSLTVYPVFVDSILKVRNTQTPENYEMMEILFSDIRCDMGLALSTEITLDGDIRSLIRKNSTAIYSTLKGKESEYNSVLTEITKVWTTPQNTNNTSS